MHYLIFLLILTIPNFLLAAVYNSEHFDYSFHGNLIEAVNELQKYDPAIKINNMMNQRYAKQPLTVNIDINNTSLNNLLRIINAQVSPYATVSYQDNTINITSNTPDSEPASTDQAYKAWIKNSNFPLKTIVTDDGTVQYPYGASPVTITCKIGIICDIQLGHNEILKDWALSDTVNWIIYGDEKAKLAYSGAENKLTPHVLIKPTENATLANLVVLTDSHSYNIMLKASSDEWYNHSIGFYFPPQQLNIFSQQPDSSTIKTSTIVSQAIQDNNLDQDSIAIDKLNLNNYEISGDNVDWKPTTVFDDGSKVWIQFDHNNHIAPALLEITDKNELKLLEYFPRNDNMFLVKTIFNKAVLLLGINRQQQKVYITRKHLNKTLPNLTEKKHYYE